MGHKGPVLWPRCFRPGRARTQLLFYSILRLQTLTATTVTVTLLSINVTRTLHNVKSGFN